MLEHDGVLDTRAAAILLGRSRNAIYIAVRRGRIPARRWGRRLVFLRSDLAAFLNTLPRSGPKGPPEEAA